MTTCTHPKSEEVKTATGAIICAACGTVTKAGIKITTAALPEAGDRFTFEYSERDCPMEVVTITVVDVTDEHVMYKLSGSNHIYPMTHGVWIENKNGRVPVCKHERGWIENHRRIPATYEMPSEETGRVICRECGEEWTLGYEPSGMDLKAA